MVENYIVIATFEIELLQSTQILQGEKAKCHNSQISVSARPGFFGMKMPCKRENNRVTKKEGMGKKQSVIMALGEK